MLMTRSVTEKSGFLRFGYVSSYDPDNHTARVTFPAMNNVVSAPLPVCTSSSSGNRYVSHLAAGTHVACIMSGQGTESGVIIGTIYDDKNSPPVLNPAVECISFSDGATIQYDSENHSMNIDVPGTVTISGHDVIISGNSVVIETDSASMSFGLGAANITAQTVKLDSTDTTIKAQGDIALRSIGADGKITVNKDIEKI